MVKAVGSFKIFLGTSGDSENFCRLLATAREQQVRGRNLLVLDRDDILKRADLDETTRTRLKELPDVPFPDAENQLAQSHHPGLLLIENLGLKVANAGGQISQYAILPTALAAGWDVYATVDINQIEGVWPALPLSDDCVPMAIIEQANVIELVETTPASNKSKTNQKAISFQETRERRQAALELIARHMKNPIRTSGIVQYPSSENKILVCVSSHPLAERLVWAGKKMADDLQCPWTVLYVETPERLRFSVLHNEQLEATLTLAKELGGEVVRISGQNISASILEYAHHQHVTRIILGNPQRTWWQDTFGNTLVDKIIRQSGLMEVFVINDDRSGIQPGILESFKPHSRWPQYLKAVGLVCFASLISYPLHLGIEPANLVMIFLAAVVLSAIYIGRGPAFMASILSVLIFDFFMIEPKLSFSIRDTQYLITLLSFFVVSVVISNLVSTIRVQVEDSQRRESRTNALYNLSRGLAASLDPSAMVSSIIEQVHQAFHKESAVFIHSQNATHLQNKSDGFQMENGWEEIAYWVIQNNQPAGFGTRIFPEGTTYYHPLSTASSVIGILAVQFPYKDRWLSTEKKQLLEAYAAMAAVAIEKTALSEAANQARLVQEKEKLQTALMNSISHDLRTPLATITGVLSTLQESEGMSQSLMDAQSRLDLIETGYEEAERLNRLVGNLLDMTRLESGSLTLKKTECDVMDIVGSVLGQMKNRLEDRVIQTEIASELPAIWVDQVLIEQVLVNLLDNAIKYSDPGKVIQISALENQGGVEISVIDQGRGISAEEQKQVFEKFYRGTARSSVNGSGLGLAICKGLVEIHGGKIWVEANPQDGVAFTFWLPLENIANREGIRE